MPHRILKDKWSDYNKKKDYKDRFIFSYETDWEVDFLVEKIEKHLPFASKKIIHWVIDTCGSEIPAPRPRGKFVGWCNEEIETADLNQQT